jgi:hypothetical protein
VIKIGKEYVGVISVCEVSEVRQPIGTVVSDRPVLPIPDDEGGDG